MGWYDYRKGLRSEIKDLFIANANVVAETHLVTEFGFVTRES